MNILKHSIKKFIYGTLPYYFMKGYKPDSPYLKYYKYIRKHGYSRHLYEFKDEYLSMPVDVRKDENRNLYYVLKEDGKRLYFQRTTPPHKIQKYYRALMIEQDQRSAHHYFNNNKDVTGKVFVDVGCAEGYSSLEIIEEAKHVYLFEQNESWLEAIRATFEPWKDKVTIVQKYVSNRNSPKEQKLDDFFRDKPDETSFKTSTKMPPSPQSTTCPNFSSYLAPINNSVPFSIGCTMIARASGICIMRSNSNAKCCSPLILSTTPPTSDL